jgi:hypothetical protein
MPGARSSPAAGPVLSRRHAVGAPSARGLLFTLLSEFTGEPSGLRTVQRGPLMLVYLTDVRGERVVIIQVNWIG